MLARMLQQIIQMSAHFSEYRCSTGAKAQAKAPDPFSATDAALKGRSSTVASGPS
jgi:hypothetical protein